MIRIFPLLVLVLLMISCERDVGGQGFGPSTSLLSIEQAQQLSLRKLDPHTIQQGQRIHHIESQEIISSQAPIKVLSKEWVTEVQSIEEDDEEKILTTQKIVTDKFWDEDFIYEFKSVYFLAKVKALSLLDQLDEERYSEKGLIKQAMKASQVEAKDITGVSYHNLKSKEVTLVPPEKVKKHEACKGLKNCRIKADQITYDVVFRLRDGNTQTHNIEWLISPDVPFFAAILKQCASTVVPLEAQRVLVKQCNEVVDFDN